MADYYDNTKQVLPLSILSPYLVNKVTSTGVHGLRVKVVTYSAAYEKPIAGYRDIEDLIRQCIVVASDGKPAIRVVLTEKANGAGLR